LLIYRFDADLVFFNCDHFRERVNKKIREAQVPVEWVLIDAGPVNVIDYTALQKLRELRKELNDQGILLVFSDLKHALAHFFRRQWIKDKTAKTDDLFYPTVKSALHAFEHRKASGS